PRAACAGGLGPGGSGRRAAGVVGGLGRGRSRPPVGVRFFPPLSAPPLPEAAVSAAELQARFVEPLPDVAAPEVVALVEYLARAGGEEEIFRIADEIKKPFDRLIGIVKAGELLGFVDTPQHLVTLTNAGQRFVAADADERAQLWRDQLLRLRLVRDVRPPGAAPPGPPLDPAPGLEATLD